MDFLENNILTICDVLFFVKEEKKKRKTIEVEEENILKKGDYTKLTYIYIKNTTFQFNSFFTVIFIFFSAKTLYSLDVSQKFDIQHNLHLCNKIKTCNISIYIYIPPCII